MTFTKKSGLILATALLVAPLSLGTMDSAMAADPQWPAKQEKYVDVSVTIPEFNAKPREFEVTDAQFRWGLSREATSGAHAYGCNFLSAGIAGDTGSSRPWSKSDGFYAAEAGETRIEKPNAAGKWVADSWETKCLDASGRQVGTTANEQGTGAQVVIDGGTGSVNSATGKSEIRWKGSFSVAMYGGMTYWSATDPVLTVANGKGTLKATLSGYGADRVEADKWFRVAPREVTLATMPGVALGEHGIVATPAYKRVKIDGIDPAQFREGPDWGAFPADFVKFQLETGQSSYWYSSGIGDGRKVASTMYTSYTPEVSVLPDTPPETGAPDPGGPSTDSSGQGTGSGSIQPPSNDGGSIVSGGGGTVLGGGTVVQSSPVGTVLAAATTATVSAANWLGGSLIPEAIELAKDYRELLLWGIAGLLGLATLAWVGFRRGWLFLPFQTPKPER